MRPLRIVYVIGLGTISENNGIKKQAEIWRSGLEKLGHTVTLHSPWMVKSLTDCDLIHVFGNGLWIIETIQSLAKLNIPIVISPIIDSYKPHWLYWLASRSGFPRLRIYSINYALRAVKPLLSRVLVRSMHEYGYISDVYRYNTEKISLLRLPSRMSECDITVKPKEKEQFCLHVSTYTQPRKNVWRLMEAAVKYKFQLVIAGQGGNKRDIDKYEAFANKNKNIKILGPVDEKTLCNLYRRAKVFALPSIEEGVGLVGLEAAMYGCNIVITNIGGPKEYYEGKAFEVNPLSIDSIGQGILKAFERPISEELQALILTKYSLTRNISELAEIYYNTIKEKKY